MYIYQRNFEGEIIAITDISNVEYPKQLPWDYLTKTLNWQKDELHQIGILPIQMADEQRLKIKWDEYMADKDIELELANNQKLAPIPIADSLDWDGLQAELLAGDLYPLFQRLTIASLASSANAVSTARGDISNVILTVRIEAALASGLQMLTQIAEYQFTDEEKNIWNLIIAELGFGSSVYL